VPWAGLLPRETGMLLTGVLTTVPLSQSIWTLFTGPGDPSSLISLQSVLSFPHVAPTPRADSCLWPAAFSQSRKPQQLPDRSCPWNSVGEARLDTLLAFGWHQSLLSSPVDTGSIFFCLLRFCDPEHGASLWRPHPSSYLDGFSTDAEPVLRAWPEAGKLHATQVVLASSSSQGDPSASEQLG
jgi:hypothetical protein